MSLMNKPVTLTFVIYAAWAFTMFMVALYGQHHEVGEYGISAHLWLTITGLPSSWVSWALPHASLFAIVVAGLAGCLQWPFIVWLYSRRNSGRRAH